MEFKKRLILVWNIIHHCNKSLFFIKISYSNLSLQNPHDFVLILTRT